MLALHRQAPECPIYFGDAAILERQRVWSTKPLSWKNGWRQLDLAEFADQNPVMFPGQLFSIAEARAVGNFRPISLFTGDWDFWFRMALRGGLAQSATEVSVVRSHYGWIAARPAWKGWDGSGPWTMCSANATWRCWPKSAGFTFRLTAGNF